MRYEIEKDFIKFLHENPLREQLAVAFVSRVGISLPQKILVLLLDSFIRRASGKKFDSQKNFVALFLRPFLCFFRATKKSWPNTAIAWQILLLEFHQFYLASMDWSEASPNTRIECWNELVVAMFNFFIRDGIVPCSVVIPRIKKKHVKRLATDHPVLGLQHPTPTDIPDNTQKLLLDVNFAMTDAAYLDVMEASCRRLITLIGNIGHSYWAALMHDEEVGSRLSAQISNDEIENAITTGNFREQISEGASRQLASHDHPKGYRWAIAIFRYQLENGLDENCVSTDTLLRTGFFLSNSFNSPYTALQEHTALEKDRFNMYSGRGQLSRFAGLLSPLDTTVACCLLIIEHPEFTPGSLHGAKLLNVRGKHHLLLTDNDDEFILTVDKPRARQRKTVVLTPTALRIVNNIIRLTEQVRRVLKRAGSKLWRYLFLGCRRDGRLAVVEGSTKFLTREKKALSLIRLYPELSESGLTVGRFDFKRIRCTMGVLQWFETGSIREMSRRLGNSRRVVIEHYLPPALLYAWNLRIIRRFQNMLIILAAHSEDYLLDVTDFSTMTELQNFIAQLVLEHPAGSSPIADAVAARLGGLGSAEEASGASRLGHFNVRLSAHSLGYLYAFSDMAVRSLSIEELQRVDAESQLAPIHFVDLAKLIRHACECAGTSEVGVSLREILDLPLLQLVHVQALEKQGAIGARMQRSIVRREWSDNDEARVSA